MSNDLKARTARSSLFVINESLRALRQNMANLDDPSSIDRVIREAEIMSTSLKKLHGFIGVEPVNEMPASAGSDIDLEVVTRCLLAFRENRVCLQCGGVQAEL
jgi:hypothetical protein